MTEECFKMKKFIYIKAKLSNSDIFYKFYNLSMIVTNRSLTSLFDKHFIKTVSILLYFMLNWHMCQSCLQKWICFLRSHCGLWYSRLFWVFHNKQWPVCWGTKHTALHYHDYKEPYVRLSKYWLLWILECIVTHIFTKWCTVFHLIMYKFNIITMTLYFEINMDDFTHLSIKQSFYEQRNALNSF